MSKETHVVRVWAKRGSRRTLEFSVDVPDARCIALARVERLRLTPDVDEIEMREHILMREGVDRPTALRQSLRWIRTDGHWRRVANGQAS